MCPPTACVSMTILASDWPRGRGLRWHIRVSPQGVVVGIVNQQSAAVIWTDLRLLDAAFYCCNINWVSTCGNTQLLYCLIFLLSVNKPSPGVFLFLHLWSVTVNSFYLNVNADYVKKNKMSTALKSHLFLERYCVPMLRPFIKKFQHFSCFL